MSDLTIIIQGNITQECFNFYLENYRNYKIIISTWDGYSLSKENGGDFNCMKTKFKYKPKIIVSERIECGPQNFICQVVSTLNALNQIETKYAIKIRGDEYYSNFEYAIDCMKNDENKIFTSPIFFRPWQLYKFHISDHIIGGITSNMKLMFQTSYDEIFTKKEEYSDNLFTPSVAEQKLTYFYLKNKELIVNENNGVSLLKKHFDIFDIDMMKPYLVKSHADRDKWYDTFIPNKNMSIKNIDDLME